MYYQCAFAGEYALAVRLAGSEALIGGRPVGVRVDPETVAVASCQVTIAECRLLWRTKKHGCLAHHRGSLDLEVGGHTSASIYYHVKMVLFRRLQAVLEGPAAEGRAVAGTEVRVALDMRDRFGNISASRSEQHVAVEATGACTAPFEEFTTDSFRCERMIVNANEGV